MNDWSSNRLTTAFSLLAAAGLVVGTLLVLTTGPSPLSAEQRPLWATVLLATVLVGGVAAAAAVLWRGWDPLSAYAVFLEGALAGVGLTRVPMENAWYTAFVGTVLACAGVWHLRPRALVSDHRLALGATALAAAVAELAFGAVSTLVWMVPYLWGPGGLGYAAAPVAAVATARAVRAVESARRIPVALAGLGAVVFFFAPLWSRGYCTAGGCSGLYWSHLTYSLDLSKLAFSYEENCNGCGMGIAQLPVLAGVGAFAVGVATDRAAAWRPELLGR